MMTTMMKRRAPEVRADLLNKGGRWYKLDEIFQAATKIRLDACIEIATLLENEGISQRDPRYITQEDIADRYRISQQTISQYKAIGDDKRVTSALVTELPKSLYTVYLLTTIENKKDFDKHCRPDVTREEISEYKRRLSAPPPAPVTPPQPQRPPCPGVEGTGPGQYELIGGEWYKNAGGFAENPKQMASSQKIPPRAWLSKYILTSTNEELIAALKGLRRAVHPRTLSDGNHDVSVILNQYIGELE